MAPSSQELEPPGKSGRFSKRLGRRRINLAGVQGTTEPQAHIQEQFNRLSRLVVLQDAFDALLEPVTLLSRAELSRMLDAQALQAMTAILIICCYSPAGFASVVASCATEALTAVGNKR